MKKLILLASMAALQAAAQADITIYADETAFQSAMSDGFTVIDTSANLGLTTDQLSAAFAGATFFGQPSFVRGDGLIPNGAGFDPANPSVAINFDPPVNGIGVTSNPIDGGTALAYSGPDGSGILLGSVEFGELAPALFGGLISTDLIGSVVFTCEYNFDLRCGLIDPTYSGVVIDTDGDGVADTLDNCTDVINPSQQDTNGDGYGNRCDADIDNNCIVNFSDLQAMQAAFFSSAGSPSYDPDADFDSSNTINFADLQLMKEQFFGPPGPGIGSCGTL